jgi:hypothetical protein
MDALWFRDKFLRELNSRKESINDAMLAGVKNFDQYEYLRGRYSSLVDVEDILRELLSRVIEDDETEQGNSS